MIKDYLRSPAHYYRKWIKREIDLPLTPSLKVGTVVDAILSNEPIPFHVKVLAKDNKAVYDIQKSFPEDKLISASDMEKAKAMAARVKEMKFWQYPRGTRLMQLILEGEIRGLQVCGKPDILEIEETATSVTVGILDIKTATPGNCKSVFGWRYTCEEFGYVHQLFMYFELVNQNITALVPNLNGRQLIFQFGHIVISYERDEYVKVQLFRIEAEAILAKGQEIYRACEGIRDQKFEDTEPSWDDAPLVPFTQPGLVATVEAEPQPEEETEDSIES